MTTSPICETDEAQRKRLLGIAEQATAELCCILRAHLYRHTRPPTNGLCRAITTTMAALTALRAIVPDGHQP